MSVFTPSQQPVIQKSVQGILSTFIVAWLIAGTLDALAAVFILAGGQFTLLFQSIASGAFGNAAFSGGTGMVCWGIAFHYFIAGCFTAFYFIIYPYLAFLKKSVVWSSVLYGVFVWAVMHFVLHYFTALPKAPFNLTGAVKNAVILMFTIGLPNSFFRRRI